MTKGELQDQVEELRSEIELLEAELKHINEVLEDLVALRDKEQTCGPESILPIEWQKVWRKAGARA